LSKTFEGASDEKSLSSADESHSFSVFRKSSGFYGMQLDEIEEKEKLKNSIQNHKHISITLLKLILFGLIFIGIGMIVIGYVISNDIIKKAHNSSLEMEEHTLASNYLIMIAYNFQQLV